MIESKPNANEKQHPYSPLILPWISAQELAFD
jgi:hypothetical protein